MKDFVGNELRIGDNVVYISDMTDSFIKGKVVAFTDDGNGANIVVDGYRISKPSHRIMLIVPKQTEPQKETICAHAMCPVLTYLIYGKV